MKWMCVLCVCSPVINKNVSELKQLQNVRNTQNGYQNVFGLLLIDSCKNEGEKERERERLDCIVEIFSFSFICWVAKRDAVNEMICEQLDMFVFEYVSIIIVVKYMIRLPSSCSYQLAGNFIIYCSHDTIRMNELNELIYVIIE